MEPAAPPTDEKTLIEQAQRAAVRLSADLARDAAGLAPDGLILVDAVARAARRVSDQLESLTQRRGL